MQSPKPKAWRQVDGNMYQVYDDICTEPRCEPNFFMQQNIHLCIDQNGGNDNNNRLCKKTVVKQAMSCWQNAGHSSGSKQFKKPHGTAFKSKQWRQKNVHLLNSKEKKNKITHASRNTVNYVKQADNIAGHMHGLEVSGRSVSPTEKGVVHKCTNIVSTVKPKPRYDKNVQKTSRRRPSTGRRRKTKSARRKRILSQNSYKAFKCKSKRTQQQVHKSVARARRSKRRVRFELSEHYGNITQLRSKESTRKTTAPIVLRKSESNVHIDNTECISKMSSSLTQNLTCSSLQINTQHENQAFPSLK